MTRFVGLGVSQKLTAICVVGETGRRVWRRQCATDPGQIERAARGHAGDDARIGVETGRDQRRAAGAGADRAADVPEKFSLAPDQIQG